MTDRYWQPRLIAARTFLAAGATQTAIMPPAAKPAAAAGPATSPVAAAIPTPAEKPAAIKPASGTSAVQPASAEIAIVDIGFVIPAEKKTFTDRIPTAAGTSVAFTLTNGTGKDGTFMVLFFRIDPRTYKLQQIHEEKVKLAAKAAFSLPPYNYELPGKYKLVVKDSWGNQLFEREFMVESAGG
jgi:hypothetical protein